MSERRTLVIRDMELDCLIGVHAHEKRRRQRVRISVDLETEAHAHDDDISRVLSYEELVVAIEETSSDGHMHLVETLADRIVDVCFAFPSVHQVRVTVLKPELLAGTGALGITIERSRTK